MRLFVAFTLFLAFVLPGGLTNAQSSTETNQAADDWSKKIVGTWELHRPATASIWKGTFLEEVADEIIPMFPFVPERIQFGKDGAFQIPQLTEQQAGKQAKVKSAAFDPQQKRLVIQISNDFGDSTLVFDVVDENRLIVHAPTFVGGPTRAAYRRVVDAEDEKEHNVLTKFAGNWNLNLDLTKKWWEEKLETVAQDGQRKRYKSINEEIKSISIKNSRLEFANQTTEFLRSLDTKIEPNQPLILVDSFNRQTPFEITRLHDDVIKYVDTRRQYVAIYVRAGRDGKIPQAENLFLQQRTSPLIQNFDDNYQKEVLPALDDQVESRYVDGAVELERINIQRMFASGAVDYADLTNMSLDFFIDTGFSNRICDGQRIKLSQLGPIFDDTGKPLLTKGRRQSIKRLEKFQDANSFSNKRDGRSGVNFSIRLDAPAIGARRMESIEGEVIVKGYTLRKIEIKDLRSRVGKPIEHPLLPDLKITPIIEEGEFPDVILKLAGEDSRLKYWFITDSKDNLLDESSVGEMGDSVSKGFIDGIPEKISLWLVVASDESEATHKFLIDDIDFP